MWTCTVTSTTRSTGRRSSTPSTQAIDAPGPLAAELDYRDPVDLGDEVELLRAAEGGGLLVGLRAGAVVKAVARVEAR